jgi:hypothetical protein
MWRNSSDNYVGSLLSGTEMSVDRPASAGGAGGARRPWPPCVRQCDTVAPDGDPSSSDMQSPHVRAGRGSRSPCSICAPNWCSPYMRANEVTAPTLTIVVLPPRDELTHAAAVEQAGDGRADVGAGRGRRRSRRRDGDTPDTGGRWTGTAPTGSST